MSCQRLVISGRVQGVGFRYWMAGEAERNGIGGWVRNRPNGNVEAVICGDQAARNSMLKIVSRGPALARVDKIDIEDCGGGWFDRFEVRPTGQ